MPVSSVPSVTTAPTTAGEERSSRMRRYLVMMGIRTGCFVMILFVEGWLQVVCIIGAVILPYIAVVLANGVRPRGVPAEATLAGQQQLRRQIGR